MISDLLLNDVALYVKEKIVKAEVVFEGKKKQQLLKLGGSIDAVINWEKQMAHLRTVNLIANWTTETDDTVLTARDQLTKIKYRTVSVDDTFDDGKEGLRVIKFEPNRMAKTDRELFREEEKYKKRTGQEIRYNFIDPDWLKTLRAKFYYEIIPTDKNNDKLTQLMFMQTIQQAASIFGLQSLNVEYLKKRFAHVMGEDFDKFFMSQTMQPMMIDPKTGQPVGGAPGSNAAPGITLPANLHPSGKNPAMLQ